MQIKLFSFTKINISSVLSFFVKEKMIFKIITPINEIKKYRENKKIDPENCINKSEYWNYVRFDVINNSLKNNRYSNYRL